MHDTFDPDQAVGNPALLALVLMTSARTIRETRDRWLADGADPANMAALERVAETAETAAAEILTRATPEQLDAGTEALAYVMRARGKVTDSPPREDPDA